MGAGLAEPDRHKLLTSQDRRAVVALLEERQLPMDLDEIAAGIARRQDGSADRSRAAIERVKVRLHHTHLPLMDDVGVIDYDPEAKRVDGANFPPEF